MDIVKCLCQHCNRFTVVPKETIEAAGVRELVEALEYSLEKMKSVKDSASWAYLDRSAQDSIDEAEESARTALARYRGEA